ncbi:hypothetical protein CY35_01G053800 [Sphagnum magellanicum]|nr:hypothetical protein CY35_01G053800 [Sphagnum magellanicum]KAH9574371.1 hypothetical protein CY35_01G053800 [Sphagnum magellanicum]KAH9574372.1 hypothetical protein CY35_01G053800 [Sphagnum magellanicum]
MGSLSPVLAAKTASKSLTPISGICSHNGRHQCNFSNGYIGRRCEWRRCLSLCSYGREASALKRPPSALLNAAEYRKRKAEQKEEEDENDEDDDELCPVECVREFKTNSELQSILQHAKCTNTLVVVDFYRTACGSCRYIEKGFIKLCKGAGSGAASVIFLKHNVMDEYEEQSEVAEKYNIRVLTGHHQCALEVLRTYFSTKLLVISDIHREHKIPES